MFIRPHLVPASVPRCQLRPGLTPGAPPRPGNPLSRQDKAARSGLAQHLRGPPRARYPSVRCGPRHAGAGWEATAGRPCPERSEPMKSDAEIRDDVINELHPDSQVTEPEPSAWRSGTGLHPTGHVPIVQLAAAAARAAIASTWSGRGHRPQGAVLPSAAGRLRHRRRRVRRLGRLAHHCAGRHDHRRPGGHLSPDRELPRLPVPYQAPSPPNEPCSSPVSRAECWCPLRPSIQ